MFDDLCELADRLVVDTDEGFDDQDLKRLLEVARRQKAQASIGDLNWARLMAWRHVAAQYFEEIERALIAGGWQEVSRFRL